MLLFNSLVFGAFVSFLVDYWLGRANVPDNKRLIISVISGVLTAVFVFFGRLAVF